MKHNIRTSIVIGLVVIAMCSFVTGCANKRIQQRRTVMMICQTNISSRKPITEFE